MWFIIFFDVIICLFLLKSFDIHVTLTQNYSQIKFPSVPSPQNVLLFFSCFKVRVFNAIDGRTKTIHKSV